MLTLGIDIGSATSKAVVLKDGTELLAKALRQGGIGSEAPGQVFQEVLALAGCAAGQLAAITATGYGRGTFPDADYRISELSCHARGAHFLLPGVQTVIDIGGQDAKVIRLDGGGRMTDFLMNDKCAAGTGRFLEVMARILSCDISRLSDLAMDAEALPISSTCAVFAETEVISKLAANVSRENIAAGVHLSVARRVAGLALRCGVVPPVMMSGGVARNACLVKTMSEELKQDIYAPEDCQYCGALGAAVLAWEKQNK